MPRARRRPEGRSAGPLAFGLLATSVAVPTVIGLLAVELAADIGLGDARLGLVVSAFWAVTAVAAPLAGRWVDHRGWRRGALWGALVTAACLLACVLLVDSWVGLLVVVGASGLGYAFASPTSNIAVMRLVAPGRQASVLGLKQTAPPLLMAAAGATLPGLAHLYGWRAAVACVLVLPATVLLLVAQHRGREGVPAASGSRGPDHASAAERHRARRALVPMVVAAGLGTFSVATLTGFAVLTLVAAGLGAVAAAWVVSGGSLLAVVARVAAGRFLDRRPPSDVTPLLSVMGVAVVALVMVALGGVGVQRTEATGWQALVVTGVLVALVAAWTWPALLLIAVVRSSVRPGAASGLLQLGSGLGSAVGPVVFGVLSEAGGRGWAWGVMAALTLVAMTLVRRPAA